MKGDRKPYRDRAKKTYRCRINGKDITLGRLTQSRVDVDLRYAEEMVKAARGVASDKIDHSTQLISSLVSEYKSLVERVIKPETWRNWKRYLDLFSADLGDKTWRELQREHVIAWAAGKTTWGRGTRRLALQRVKAFIMRMREMYKLEHNPWGRANLPQSKPSGSRLYIKPDIWLKMLARAKPWLKVALKALRGTGLRPGMVCNIDRNVFQPDRQALVFQEHKTADQVGELEIMLMPPALQFFTEQAAKLKGPWLVPNSRGGKLTTKKLTAAIKRLARRVGWEGRLPSAYWWRYTFATDMCLMGVKMAVVAKSLGHSSTKMLIDIYQKYSGEEQRELAPMAARLWAELYGPAAPTAAPLATKGEGHELPQGQAEQAGRPTAAVANSSSGMAANTFTFALNRSGA